MTGPTIPAVRIREFGAAPEFVDVPMPACPRRGAVIRVRATGLCRNDWHGWMGHDDGIRLPHVPGHEFAGVIEEVGAEVRDWKAGDRVTAPLNLVIANELKLLGSHGMAAHEYPDILARIADGSIVPRILVGARSRSRRHPRRSPRWRRVRIRE